ncbi:MAG TPA: cytochrome c maturation protein CcmE [Magnetospirillaceae bacterium]|nr:cytochrome c maturation protein CcmE [Magnetospirillaceae bacterium]
MTRKQRRLYFVLLGLLAIGGATALVLTALGDTMVYFYTPSEMTGKQIGPERRVRIGGLVEKGSVTKEQSTTTFTITDLTATLPVTYTGVLPDLFREGQGVVAEGRIGRDGVFHASEVLAKHDEKYMPKEVADQLKKSGRWQEGAETAK